MCNLGVGRIGHLEQTDGAGCRLIDSERIEAEPPAPICPIYRVARTFDLSERRQQFRRDRTGRKGSKQRSVLPPRLGRLFAQSVADEKEQLSRFADHLNYKVDQREGGKHDRDNACDPNRLRRVGDESLRPLYAPAPPTNFSGEAPGCSGHIYRECRPGSGMAYVLTFHDRAWIRATKVVVGSP